MSELSELERRLTEALDRIGVGLERLGPQSAIPPGSAAAPPSAEEAAEEIAALREALEAERAANAQLEERVTTIRSRQEGRLEELDEEVAALREQLQAAQARNRHLKRRAEEMRGALARLREASSAGAPEPQLINAAILAELEGLRAIRDADRMEMDVLLSELKPLVEEAAHA